MQTKRKISLGGFELETLEFASQGNAILGIRDSGKSYTATYLAEQLCEAGIPFVAFDPIGIWRFLKTDGAGKGYPVVVAHPETGDVKLTEDNAADIVRAAMSANVPLILDLYSIHLSKAAWRRIVESSVRVLLYENQGLRHIFIEEAAEFCPQRVASESAKVYGIIESLARMGGNKQLGYTLINQRAEEVNKAVLELCDCLFLHRQKGRNSLTALSKWLDFGDKAKTRTVIEGIGRAGPGEVWLWPRQEETPRHVRIPKKQSFHPDRRSVERGSIKALPIADVSKFVEKLNAQLEESPPPAADSEFSRADREEIAELRRQLASPKIERVPVFNNGEVARLAVIAEELRVYLAKLTNGIANIETALATADAISDGAPRYNPPNLVPAGGFKAPAGAPEKLDRKKPAHRPTRTAGLREGEARILQTLASHHPLKLSQSQLGTICVYRPDTMKTYMPILRANDYLRDDGEGYYVTEEGWKTLGGVKPPLPQSKQEIQELWLSRLSDGPAKILRVLIQYRGRPITPEHLAGETGYTASTLKTYLPILRKNKLMHPTELRAAPDLL